MPRRLIGRAQLRAQLRTREVRLAAVTRQVLAAIRALISTQELQIHGAIGSLHGGHMEARVAAVWDHYRPALVTALEEPVRVYKDAADDPFPDPALGDALAAQQIGLLIQQLSPAQVAAVRAQLAALMEIGPTPAVLAGIGAATGLTTRQVGQVAAYVRRQQEAGLADDVIQRTTRSFADGLLRQRAGTIARHEAVTYTNALVHARGAQLNGHGAVTKAWVSARDDRVDFGNPGGICRVLDDGRRIPLEQPWVFRGEEYLTPPAHIGCRCLEEIWDESA